MPTPRRAWAGPVLDAIAALLCGVGVTLMAVGIKPVPAVLLDYLGFGWSLAWAAFLLVGSLTAGAGSLLRLTRHLEACYFFELIGWPVIAFAALIFALGAIAHIGLLDSLLTVGFSGFVAATCTRHWVRLWEAKGLAQKAVGRG